VRPRSGGGKKKKFQCREEWPSVLGVTEQVGGGRGPQKMLGKLGGTWEIYGGEPSEGVKKVETAE